MPNRILTALALALLAGCGNGESDEPGSELATGGAETGGGGSSPTGGTGGLDPVTGGTPATGGLDPVTGGAPPTGGMGPTTGGTPATGGSDPETGGTETGGAETGGAETGGTETGGQDGTGGGTVADPCTQTTPLSGGEEHCQSSGGGRVGDYAWSIWSSGSGGCITPYDVGAAFSATWNESGDFLAGVGLMFDQTQTYDQLGTIYADYAYTRTGTAGGYSYVGIYGWTVDPLIEYYIVDDYFGQYAPNITWGDGVQQGELEVDGGTYRIFTHTQVEQPSIEGTQTFVQFFSVRQEARQCGRISITAHWEKWAELGMNLGNLHEAKILAEAGGGTGSIDYTYAAFVVE